MHRFTLVTTRPGLRLGVLAAPRFQRVLVQLHVRAGSRFETPATSGSTHLLEHVLFRGTRRYPSRQALEAALQKHGVDSNAYTEREWVSIHLVAPRASAGAALRLALEIGFNPTFQDVDVERRIVEAEIREWHVNGGLADERLGRLLWGGHALGFPVAGRRSPPTSRRGLQALHRRFFTAANSLLVVAGHVAPESIRRAVRAALAGLEGGTPRLPSPPPPRRGPRLRLGPDASRELRVVFHLLASGPLEDPDRLHLWVAGRLMWERLNRIVREDRGACYDLEFDDEHGHALNAVSLHAIVRRAAGPMFVRELFRQLRQVRDGVGDRGDLERVRAHLIRAYELMPDDLHDLTDFYARQVLLWPGRRPLRPREAIRAARRVDLQSTAAAARRRLDAKALTLVLMRRWTDRERPAWKKRFARLVEEFLL